MNTLLFFLLISSVLTCNPYNPIYSIILSNDVYADYSNFRYSFNPLVGSETKAYLHELIEEPSKCFIRFEDNLVSYQPKISLYSARASSNGEILAYFIVIRGTTLSLMDVVNDNLILAGRVPTYVTTALNYIKPLMNKLKGKEVIFSGHSLGAFVAHSLAFIFNKFSVGFESPGTHFQINHLENLAGDGRKYQEHHLTKAIEVSGIPNIINYLLPKINYRHLVIFAAPITNCLHFFNPIWLNRLSFIKILMTPGWTLNYHSSDNIIDSLVRNKTDLAKVMVENYNFKLKSIFEDPRMDGQYMAIHHCLLKYSFHRISFQELKQKLLDEIYDYWESN